MKFQTTLGQAVYDSVFLPAKINVSANFLPRRMAFAYELGDEEWDGSGVPTTLRRSKEDCPKVSPLSQGHGHVHCHRHV